MPLLIALVLAELRAAVGEWVPLMDARSLSPDDTHQALQPATTQPLDDTRPRLLVSQSCSGSSFISAMLLDFMRSAGWVPYPGNVERLDAAKNSFYKAEPRLGMATAVRRMQADALAHEQLLFVKSFVRAATRRP